MDTFSKTLKGRLSAKGKKRILALDGGGIRGAVTIGFLEKMESILAARHPEIKDFRLCHYFDLIGGTSTGAIIATLLVTGHSASEIKQLYLQLGEKIFSDRNGFNLLGKQIYTNSKYDSAPLKEELESIFKDYKLGDDSNKTGLCIVSKRLDTCSTWPVTNNPDAIFFNKNRFYLRNIVRASTAAPSYFEPELIDVGDGEVGVFVDGGMSLMNNPAWQMYLVATLKGFKLEWETGEDNMFIVSIGTGRRDKKLIGGKWANPNLLKIATEAPNQFMSDASEHIELMMQLAGRSTGPLREIDLEVGDLGNDAFHGVKGFSYLRYNMEMNRERLKEIGIENFSDTKIATLMEMDMPQNVNDLMKIGEMAGAKYVGDGHLPEIFDVK
jgi:hypothetical protein